MNNLAIFNLFKIIVVAIQAFGKVFYKLCYWLGWGTVYGGRLVYLIAQKFLIFNFIIFKILKIRIFNYYLKIKNYKIRNLFPARLAFDAARFRPAVMFAVVLLILILPFKAFTYYKSLSLDDLKSKVASAGEEAMRRLSGGAESAAGLNFSQAQKNFSQAGENFLQAQNELKKINDLLFVLAGVAPSEDLRLASEAKDILAAGEAASKLGNDLSSAMDSLFGDGNNKGSLASNEEVKLPKRLNNFNRYGRLAIGDARELRKRFEKIDVNNLPENYKAQFLSVKEKSEFLEKGLSEFIDLAEAARNFLGANEDKRYLLVFQNNAEMRGSGGFIGSFALVDFKDGKIKSIEAPGGGSYDTTAGLKEKILPPEPFYLVGVHWRFWDANWWPDWIKSAKKLAWFYEKSDGPTVDGVIGITPTAVEKFLAVIGPIDMKEKYGIEITADNFWSVTQEIVEEKKSGAKEPKKIIGDLMAKIMEEIPNRLNKDNIVGLIKAAEESLSEKHILFYFNDSELEKKADEMGWSGRMKETKSDHLMIANTNIAGGKTDRRIRETINHEAEIMPNGSIIDTLKIVREHTGGKGEPYVGTRNVNWMRIYVPAGSELIEAQGFEKPDDIFFKQPEEGWNKDGDVAAEERTRRIDKESGTEIYEEGNYTVFANWSLADPGETITVYLKYKLPFNMAAGEKSFWEKLESIGGNKLSSYSLLAQKQPGSFGSAMNSILKLPEGYNMIWQYPENPPKKDYGWQISDKLNTDKYWAAIIENEK
ncbi:DUF4012 domain-containing protein [Candidatus Falkowbacteria bacterium]|nr:DUF4012 domain-containing protein [Candidatus Falkowbacteria bacterium]